MIDKAMIAGWTPEEKQKVEELHFMARAGDLRASMICMEIRAGVRHPSKAQAPTEEEFVKLTSPALVREEK